MKTETKTTLKGLGIAYLGMFSMTALLILEIYFKENYYESFSHYGLLLLIPIIILNLNLFERRS